MWGLRKVEALSLGRFTVAAPPAAASNLRIHTSVAVLLLLAGLAQAQSGVPAFRADRVLPSGGDRPAQLAPGMLVSIYGTDLGPQTGYAGQADPKNRETPNPLRPDRNFVDTLIYPKELCGVQVFLGERPVGLLYVQQVQINFKVPQDESLEGTASLRVVYQGRSSATAEMRLGLELATLSLEQPAHVGGPVWLHIQMPPYPRYGDVQYPVGIAPSDFGCNEFEVRHNAAPLPQIQVRAPSGFRNGPMCGSIGIPFVEKQHKNRLPLHLQYRFDQPGAYEVRYTRRTAPPSMGDSQPIFQTAWTRIEILPARQAHRPRIQSKRSATICPRSWAFRTTRTSLWSSGIFTIRHKPCDGTLRWLLTIGPRTTSITG